MMSTHVQFIVQCLQLLFPEQHYQPIKAIVESGRIDTDRKHDVPNDSRLDNRQTLHQIRSDFAFSIHLVHAILMYG